MPTTSRNIILKDETRTSFHIGESLIYIYKKCVHFQRIGKISYVKDFFYFLLELGKNSKKIKVANNSQDHHPKRWDTYLFPYWRMCDIYIKKLRSFSKIGKISYVEDFFLYILQLRENFKKIKVANNSQDHHTKRWDTYIFSYWRTELIYIYKK